MPDNTSYDELQPRQDDSPAIKKMYADIRETVGINARSRQAKRMTADRLYRSGMTHRVGAEGWDDDTTGMFTRHGIPIAIERRDRHGSWYWRQYVRLHVAPLPKFFDVDSHPALIESLAAACWVTEIMGQVKLGVFSLPSEGIMHADIGDGSFDRFAHVHAAWRTQTEVNYDPNTKPTRVPPASLFPPPPDKAPVGTFAEGVAAGRAAAGQAAMAAADRNQNPVAPLAPPMTQDDRPYAEAFRRGYGHGVTQNLMKMWSGRRGEIEAHNDAGILASEDVSQGRPPRSPDEITLEACKRTGPPSYEHSYLKIAPADYAQRYAQLTAASRQQAEQAKREREQAELERQQAQQARQRAEQAQQEAERSRQQAELERLRSQQQTEHAEQGRRQAEQRAAAAEQERQRVEQVIQQRDDEERKKQVAAAARRSDERHQAKVRDDIIAALVKARVPRIVAEVVYQAIHNNTVPHLRIIY